MLVLKLKRGESVLIDGRIRVHVSDSGFESARLAIDAPADVAVYREEIAQRIRAAGGDPSLPPRSGSEAEPVNG